MSKVQRFCKVSPINDCNVVENIAHEFGFDRTVLRTCVTGANGGLPGTARTSLFLFSTYSTLQQGHASLEGLISQTVNPSPYFRVISFFCMFYNSHRLNRLRSLDLCYLSTIGHTRHRRTVRRVIRAP